MPDLLDDLTPDQRAAVTHTDGPLLILAGAGSGKTRVITRRVAFLLRQGVRPGSILAITFTNKAAGEMRTRVEHLCPGNRVFVSTFHSLGARLLRQYADRLGLDKNFTIYDIDDRNKLVKQALDSAGVDNVRFTPERVAGAISKAKNQLLTPTAFERQAHDFFAQTAAKAYHLYEKKLRAANAMDFDDLLYLPAMALKTNDEFRQDLDARFKYVMVDEYQDTNLAQYEIARRLSITNPNLCVVGDPDQCVLPGSMVATPDGPRAAETVRDGDPVTTAVGWGKVGTRAVEKVMVSQYHGKVVRVRVEGGAVLRMTPNHVCFAKVHATPDRHFVYLMWKRGVGYRIGTTRGVRASKDGVVMSGLQVRTNQEVADAVWIVRTCSSSAEARFNEHFLSVKYGIPTMVFFVRGRRMDITQDLIDKLFSDIDTAAGAARLMADLHLDVRFPHHRPGAVVRGGLARRYVHFTAFGDTRVKTVGRCHEHRVQFVTSGDALRVKALAAGLPVRNGVRGTWRIETSRAGYDHAQSLADAVIRLDDLEPISRARLTAGKAFPFQPASHLQPGMVVPVFEDGAVREREVLDVSWEDYDGPVYDLSVPETRNFIASGLVVHNSIYKWRGSDIKNILDFERDFPGARVITLNQNYRSTKAVLHAASTLIDRNKQRKKKTLTTDNADGEAVKVITFDTGLDEADGVVERIKSSVAAGKCRYRDHAIFLRINALSRTLESAFVKHGVPFQIVKGLAFFDRKENKDVLAYLRLLANPADPISFLRAVNEPARGIGKTSLERLQRYAADNELTLFAAAGQVARVPEIKGKAATGLKDFYKLMTDLRTKLELPPHELIRELLDASGYRKMLKDSTEADDADRLANIEELITAAKQFHAEDESRQIGDFLEQITLASDVDGWDEQQDCVSVMTLHAAKGLEFPVVYLLAVEHGLLPHERSLGKDEDVEEERRLCFVGMTRAMKELNLTHARLREFRGQTLYAVPSMFLEELPPEVVKEDGRPNSARGAVEEWRLKAGVPAGGFGMRPAIPPSDPAGYAIGQVVQHTEYGIGQVTDVSGFGATRRVKVRFPAGGEKTFVADKAPMKVVQKKG